MTISARDLRRVVIVGAGIGGLRAAETLRREGFEGTVTLVGDETHPPYDRPALSKDVLATDTDPRQTHLRPIEKYGELGIDLLLGRSATGLDLERRRVLLGSEELPYDALIIATGVAARRFPHWQGAEHPHVLRTVDDAARVQGALTGARHLTVVGAGFIGSEVASGARQRGLDVTVLELEHTPLARALGPEMATTLMELHRENGTRLRLGVTITGVEGDGRLCLSDGTVLETDVVVAGIGVTPNIRWLRDSGLELGNGVVCDATLCAGPPGVFAVGDVAEWPNPLFGRQMRVEHWTNASQQATRVARNLIRGTAEPFAGGNYVWSDQYGFRIQLAGVTTGAEVEVVSGSIADRDGLAWYRSGDRLAGSLAIGRPRQGLKSTALIEAGTSWDDALAELALWN